MIQSFMGRHRIGIIILLFLIAFPGVSHALCQVTLQWDANNPAPDGYMVFGREASQAFDYNNPWWQGDASFTRCIIDQLEEDRTYFFVVRAYAGNDSSGDSNEVTFNYSSSGNSSLNNANTTSSSGSSGGGAGCFIRSLFGSQD